MKFFESIRKFMYGRNGADIIVFASLILYVVLTFVNSFFHSFVVYIISAVVLTYGLYRTLSKNVAKRQLEAKKFTYIFDKVKSFFKLTINRFKFIKTHRYRKCTYCKATIRLPRKRGKHTVQCPKCKEDFKVNIMF